MELTLDFSYAMAVTMKGKLKMPVSGSPTLSQAEAPKLQKISWIAESIKTQEDFRTSIYEGISGHFPDLSFAMSCASVNSDSHIPVLTINQCHLFVYLPYGMVSHIRGYVQYKKCFAIRVPLRG